MLNTIWRGFYTLATFSIFFDLVMSRSNCFMFQTLQSFLITFGQGLPSTYLPLNMGALLDIHGILVPSIAYCSRLVYNEFNFDYFILSTISSGNTIASFSCCCLSSLCSRPSTELTWGCTKCLHFRLSRISSIQWPNTHWTRLHGQMSGASGV